MRFVVFLFLILTSCTMMRKISNQEIDKRSQEINTYITNFYNVYNYSNVIYYIPQVIPIYSNIVYITTNIPQHSDVKSPNSSIGNIIASNPGAVGIATGTIIGSALAAAAGSFGKEAIKDFFKDKLISGIGKSITWAKNGIAGIFRRIFRRRRRVPKVTK